MTLEIASIENKALRNAGEKADSQGNQAFNGILDASEVSAFIGYAKEEGCSMSDILSITNKVVDKNDPNVQELNAEQQKEIESARVNADKLQKLEQLEAKIEAKKQKLNNINKTADDMVSTTPREYVGGTIGALFGLGIGGAYNLMFSKLHKIPRRGLAGAIGTFMAIGCALIGSKAAKDIGSPSYEEQVQEHKAEKYKSDNNEFDLQMEIWDLEQQRNALLQELN